MTGNTYITINGRRYDAVTGMPLKEHSATAPVAPSVETATYSRGVTRSQLHRSQPQRSRTLNRRITKQPASTHTIRVTKKPAPAIQQHQAVKKFATVPVAVKTPAVTARPDRPATPHPVAVRAARTAPQPTARTTRAKQHATAASLRPVSAPAATTHTPAAILKQQAITAALAKEIAPQKTVRRPKKRRSPLARWSSVLASGFAVMLLAGYFTYLSMPNISIRMAAVQSGINASYPGYRPDGYSLSGPIAFKSGEVSMRFAYADGGAGFTLTQQRSSWDSAAVKQYVAERTATPSTTMVDGLTIYTYDGNAAWVNGGILYTLQGNAPLSSEQISKIATSL